MTEMAYAKLVAKNLRNIAFENEKTQADIARDLKISKATISSWMNGTRVPRMDKIDLLCHYFNCKRSDIMEDKQGESDLDRISLSHNEYHLILAFRKASPELQDAALRMFGIEPEKKEGSNIA